MVGGEIVRMGKRSRKIVVNSDIEHMGTKEIIMGWFIDNWISVFALLVSIGALLVSLLGYRLSNKLSKYYYMARLHIDHIMFRKASFGLRESMPPVEYEGNVKNVGMKPVYFDKVILDYGSKDNFDKRIHLVIKGNFHLKPDEVRLINFDSEWGDVDQVMKIFDLEECHYYLRFIHEKSDGKTGEKTQYLGGHGEDTNMIVAQRGMYWSELNTKKVNNRILFSGLIRR